MYLAKFTHPFSRHTHWTRFIFSLVLNGKKVLFDIFIWKLNQFISSELTLLTDTRMRFMGVCVCSFSVNENYIFSFQKYIYIYIISKIYLYVEDKWYTMTPRWDAGVTEYGNYGKCTRCDVHIELECAVRKKIPFCLSTKCYINLMYRLILKQHNTRSQYCSI